MYNVVIKIEIFQNQLKPLWRCYMRMILRSRGLSNPLKVKNCKIYSVQLHELANLFKQFLNISIGILWFLTNCLQNSFQKKKKNTKNTQRASKVVKTTSFPNPTDNLRFWKETSTDD